MRPCTGHTRGAPIRRAQRVYASWRVCKRSVQRAVAGRGQLMPALNRSYVAPAKLVPMLPCLGLAQASPGPFLKQTPAPKPHLAAYMLSRQSARAGCGSAVVLLHGAKGLGDAARQPCCKSPHAQPSRRANQQAMRASRHCWPRTFSSTALAAAVDSRQSSSSAVTALLPGTPN